MLLPRLCTNDLRTLFFSSWLRCLVAFAAFNAVGCFASHYTEETEEQELFEPPANVEGCSPGEIQTRWITGWENEHPKAFTEYEGAFYVVYSDNFRGARIEQIDAEGTRSVVGSIPWEHAAYEWLQVDGALWLAQWFGPYGGRTQTLEAGRVDPARGYVPAFSLTVPRGVKSVSALDAERILAVLDTTDDPVRTMILDVDGVVLRGPTLLQPDIRPMVYPSPEGPPYLVLGRWDGEEEREMTVGHLDDEPLIVDTEPCPGDEARHYWTCGWSFLALGDGAFLVGRSTPSVVYLERHSPGEAPLRVGQSLGQSIGRLRRAPNDSVLMLDADSLTLLDAFTLEQIGGGEFVELSDGSAPMLSHVRFSNVSAEGRFLARVQSSDAEGSRFALGQICPPEP